MVQPSLEVISGLIIRPDRPVSLPDLCCPTRLVRTEFAIPDPTPNSPKPSGTRRDATALKIETETGRCIRFPPRDSHTNQINWTATLSANSRPYGVLDTRKERLLHVKRKAIGRRWHTGWTIGDEKPNQ